MTAAAICDAASELVSQVGVTVVAQESAYWLVTR